MKSLICIGCCIAVGLSCRSTLYHPHVPDQTLQDSLQRGRRLYVQACSRCHNLHLPEEFHAARWAQELDLMQTRAGIDRKSTRLNSSH